MGAGPFVGYRVDEVLAGQSTTAVGRTTMVWGSANVQGTTVTSGTFTVDLATLKGDQPNRNAQFDGRIMTVSQCPTASLQRPNRSTLVRYPLWGHYSGDGCRNIDDARRDPDSLVQYVS